MRYFLSLALVMSSMHAFAQEKTWVGKTVLTKRFDAKITEHIGAKKGQVTALVDSISYRVVADTGAQIKIVTTQGLAGWIDKADTVLAENALKHLTETIFANPRDAGAYQKRAFVLEKQGNFEQALKDINEAIHLEWYDMGGWNSRGVLYLTRKKYNLALRDFALAIRLDPTQPAAYCNRGNVWIAKKQYAKAIRDYDAAIRLDFRVPYLYAQRGLAHFLQKDYDEAQKDFNKAEELEPNHVSALLNRARMLATAQAKRYRDGKKAVALVQQAFKLDHSLGAEALEIAATAYAEAGDFPTAIRLQGQAIESLAPDQRNDARRRLILYQAKTAYREE